MRFDSLDLKIIHALQKDARIPFVDIAQDLKVSPGLVQARYNKMKKSGVIKGSTLILSMTAIGTKFAASIGIKAIESELEEVKEYIEGLKIDDARILSWITFGRYNISMAVFSKNLLEVYKIKQLIRQHPSVLEVSIGITNTMREYSDGATTAEYEGFDLEKIFKVELLGRNRR